MTNPFRPMKYLPWAVLFQSAAATVVIATLLDYLLLLLLVVTLNAGATESIPMPAALIVPASILIPSAVSLGIGVLSIFVTEQFFRQILLTAGTMWALIGCVLLLLFVKSLLPIPGLLVGGINYFSMMGVVIGAFTYGRRHWR